MVGSARLTAFLLLALAMTVFISLLVPQAPPQAGADPNIYARWLADLRARYGPWMDALSFVGLTNVYSTLWFRIIVALLAFNLAIVLLDCIPALWRLYRGTVDAPPDPVFGPFRQRTIALSLPIGVVFDTVAHALRAAGYVRSGIMRGDQRFALIAMKGLPRMLFGMIIRAGILIVLTGLLVNERVGWHASDILFRPGQVYLVGHGKDLAVRADSFRILPSTTRAAGIMSFLHGGTVIHTIETSDRTAIHYDGIYLTLKSVGPALEVTAADVNGRTLLLQSPETGASSHARLMLLFFGASDEKFVIVPERNLVLRLVYTPGLPVGGISEAPYFQLEAFRGEETTPFISKTVSGDMSVVIGSDVFHLLYQPFGVLEIGQEPGVWLLGVGLVLVLIGVTGALWLPGHLLWVRGDALRDGMWVTLYEVLRRDAMEWGPQPAPVNEIEQALQRAAAMQPKGKGKP